MNLQVAALKWIEDSWSGMGKDFCKGEIPVARYKNLDVNNLSAPFKSEPISYWVLVEGKAVKRHAEKIAKVPYVAFSIDEENGEFHVQVQWAGRCGYGWQIWFDEVGQVERQKMCWVS